MRELKAMEQLIYPVVILFIVHKSGLIALLTMLSKMSLQNALQNAPSAKHETCTHSDWQLLYH